MTFDFPLRVRCIEGDHAAFRKGWEYRVLRIIDTRLVEIADYPYGTAAFRFKPVVRRVAGSIRT